MNPTELDLELERFNKRYLESLTPDTTIIPNTNTIIQTKQKKPNPKTRKADTIISDTKSNQTQTNPIHIKADVYKKSIVSKILNYKDDETEEYKYFDNNDQVNETIKSLINCVKTFKTKSSDYSRDVNFIFLHGSISKQIKQVPDGCVLCILTPLNRYSVSNLNDLPLEISQMQTLIKTPNFYDEFMKNPVSYGKTVYNGLFYYADIYFAGQYYYDLYLSTNNKPTDNINGLGIYREIETKSIIFDRKISKQFQLSNFFENNNKKGLVIVKCCRNIDDSHLSIYDGTIMYRFEHLMNILNKSAFISDNTEYEICDKVTEFSEFEYLIPKKLKNYRKKSENNKKYTNFTQKFNTAKYKHKPF